jgi:prolyl-tRNA editing enzyme YbaK/EbsC (Cys-tRNA(Pro) deacylase)
MDTFCMKPAVQRVIAALAAHGLTITPVEFPAETRTAQAAADAIGTDVAHIVKSLVFLADGEPIMFLVSGVNRVDEAFVSAQLGVTLARASADDVRAATGFAIGGVPPVGHVTATPIYLDRDLLQYAEVWAAAGTPHTVFLIAPATLQRITNATALAVYHADETAD